MACAMVAEEWIEPAENVRAAIVAGEDEAGKTLLPQQFIDFLNKHQVDLRFYDVAQSLPRYIRLKACAQCDVVDIEGELGMKLENVAWLSGFYKIPAQAHISWSNAYKNGNIYGMDAASGAAVTALGVEAGDHVLDLCAAPGAKLCMIAELVGSSGTVTGVDVCRQRLAACRTMVQKYGVGDACRLFVGDGTTFSLLPMTAVPQERMIEVNQDESLWYLTSKEGRLNEWRARRTRREKRRERKRSDGFPELLFYGKESGVVGRQVSEILNHRKLANSDKLGYDKVIVDAECTHDGSLKHIFKFERWGWETFEDRFFNAERISSITTLQLNLLSNGFAMVKVGGTVVYSTCSFTVDQNEGVLKRFLQKNANAEVVKIKEASVWPCTNGGVENSVRLNPLISATNGLFIAKITKIS